MCILLFCKTDGCIKARMETQRGMQQHKKEENQNKTNMMIKECLLTCICCFNVVNISVPFVLSLPAL